MVKCSPATINAAKRWLKGIETRAGSCLKTSIKMAFDESKCEAVYLVSLKFILKSLKWSKNNFEIFGNIKSTTLKIFNVSEEVLN